MLGTNINLKHQEGDYMKCQTFKFSLFVPLEKLKGQIKGKPNRNRYLKQVHGQLHQCQEHRVLSYKFQECLKTRYNFDHCSPCTVPNPYYNFSVINVGKHRLSAKLDSDFRFLYPREDYDFKISFSFRTSLFVLKLQMKYFLFLF